jgi:single-stranded DNA-binding protein
MQKNSVNKVFLIGHLGSDPEARYTKTGRATATFSVATNEAWKQKNGNNVEHTEWHSIVIYTRQWKNKEGQKGKTTEIICSNIVPLEWKKTITT